MIEHEQGIWAQEGVREHAGTGAAAPSKLASLLPSAVWIPVWIQAFNTRYSEWGFRADRAVRPMKSGIMPCSGISDARLESVWARKGLAGSNPAPSVSNVKPRRGLRPARAFVCLAPAMDGAHSRCLLLYGRDRSGRQVGSACPL